jgi:YVTN family beta-propeller protein
MKAASKAKRNAYSVVALLAILTAGCAPLPLSYRPALTRNGEVHLYLQPIPQEAYRIVFDITAIFAVRHDGGLIQLRQYLDEVKCKNLIGVQKRLASGPLPPGTYRGISLQIGAAALADEAGMADLLIPEESLFIEEEFVVARKRASTLFLSMNSQELTESGYLFSPGFSLARASRQLKTLLGFATSSQENFVSVFNKHSMQVVDTIATSSGPRGAAIDRLRGWVYVAMAGDDAIEAIEVDTGEIFNRVQLNFGDEPVELALSPDGTILVSANHGSNSASIIDTGSLREIGRVGLPSEPATLVFDRSAPRAYVMQPRSHEVSVIDLSRRAIAMTRILDESPVRGDVSREGDRLYVITRYSPDLLVLDPANLSLIARIFVGSGATSIKVDPDTDLVYVGKSTGDVEVIDPSLAIPIDQFRVNGNVGYLAMDNEENSLFLVRPDSRRVQKTHLISKKARGVIEVGEESHAVVLMGDRSTSSRP